MNDQKRRERIEKGGTAAVGAIQTSYNSTCEE